MNRVTDTGASRRLWPDIAITFADHAMAPRAAPSRRENAPLAGQDEIRGVLVGLESTPKVITRLARGCNDQVLHRPPGAAAWSARDVVAHLRACASMWGRSIERMLAEDHPTIRYISPRGWIRKTDYLGQSFGDSLREFARSRGDLVATLKALKAQDWARGATFTGTTAGREGTVFSYAKRIADHEAGHLDQIRRTLDAVKP